jgi:hypothetical protein
MDKITPLLVYITKALELHRLENIRDFEKRGFERSLMGFGFSKTGEFLKKQVIIIVGTIINLRFPLISIHRR